MQYQVHGLECPGCGAALAVGQIECEWCNRPVAISTFNSVYAMPMPMVNSYAKKYSAALENDAENKDLNRSVAMCYLKLRLYDKALPAFEKAIEDNFDNSEAYFYAAICLLEGKKAFVHKKDVIDKVQEHLEAAIMIEPKGIYYYFMAYVKYDYYARKFLKTTPTYRDLLQKAAQAGVSAYDIEQLYLVLNVSRPAEL